MWMRSKFSNFFFKVVSSFHPNTHTPTNINRSLSPCRLSCLSLSLARSLPSCHLSSPPLSLAWLPDPHLLQVSIGENYFFQSLGEGQSFLDLKAIDWDELQASIFGKSGVKV